MKNMRLTTHHTCTHTHTCTLTKVATPDVVHTGQKPFSPMAKMLLYSVGNDLTCQIPPGAIGEVCCGWRDPGVEYSADGPFGFGPIADNMVSKMEQKARPMLQEACLLAASHMKPKKWDSVVKKAFVRAGAALGFQQPITLTSSEVEKSLLRQMQWVSLSQWTTPTSTKYPSGNSVILAEVAPSLARYIRTRAKVSTIFIRDDDGYAAGKELSPIPRS